MKFAVSFAALTATLGLAGSVGAANLITNGGFETSPTPSYSTEIGPGSNNAGGPGGYDYPALAGWTVSGFDQLFYAPTATTVPPSEQYNDPGDLISLNYTPLASGGSYFVGIDADPTYGGPISQTVSGLTAGQTYQVSFEWAATQLQNRTGSTTEQVFACFTTAACTLDYSSLAYGSTAAVANGQGTAVYNNTSQGFSGWMSQTFDFTASGTSDTLTFLVFGTPGGAPPFVLLDNVSLIAVPEPAAWTMLIVGLGGIGALSRRRRALIAA